MASEAQSTPELSELSDTWQRVSYHGRQWRDTDSRALVGSDDGSLSLWRIETSECLARCGPFSLSAQQQEREQSSRDRAKVRAPHRFCLGGPC